VDVSGLAKLLAKWGYRSMQRACKDVYARSWSGRRSIWSSSSSASLFSNKELLSRTTLVSTSWVSLHELFSSQDRSLACRL
jgi:hypothetical protein